MYTKLKNRTLRKKALFGEAIAAAGINAAATMAAAGMQTVTTMSAAKQQATATQRAAQQQVNAIRQQNDLSNQLQQQSQEFIAEQNAANRDLQKDIQLQLQMLAGQQNQYARQEASKIAVRNGGHLRNRVMAKQGKSLLRGRNINEFLNAVRGLNQARINNPAGIELRNKQNVDERNVDLRNYNIANLLGMTLPLVGGGDVLGTPYIYPIFGDFSAAAYDTYINSPLLKNKVMRNDGQNGTIPFKVTDGGHVEYRGSDGQGDLYEVKGATHNQYNGTGKTGVGIKFADGEIVEAEGAGKHKKNESGGEYMYLPYQNLGIDTPALFLSKHNLPNGFNPKDAVDNGMPVMSTFAAQEYIKDLYGISDSGKESSPVKGSKKKLAGGKTAVDYTKQLVPNVLLNSVAPVAAGVAYSVNNRPLMLRNGGTIGNRQRAWAGWKDGNVVGGLIGAGANLIGGAISNIANHFAGKRLADAYTNASNLVANAYRNMRGVDMSSLRQEDYAAAHMMPALQAPVSRVAQPLAQVDRMTERRLRNIENNSASSAAANTRVNDILLQAQDYRDKIYAQDREAIDKIAQANAAAITEASRVNAALDTEARGRYTTAYLDLLKYNNDIKNQSLLGAAGALSEGITNAAGAKAQSMLATGQGWANSIAGAGNAAATGLASYAKSIQDDKRAVLGANLDNQVMWAIESNDHNTKAATINRVQTMYDNAEDDNSKKHYKALLAMLGVDVNDTQQTTINRIPNFVVPEFNVNPINDVSFNTKPLSPIDRDLFTRRLMWK